MTALQSPALIGLKEICKYARRSESTLLRMIREEGFPARKIGGNWQSTTNLIDEWQRDAIRAKMPDQQPATTGKWW